MMGEMKKRYQLPVGFSDHSATIYAGLAAASLGADMLEFHVVFDKKMFGPDAKASLTMAETKNMVAGIRMIKRSLNTITDKTDITQYKELKTMFGKSLCINKDLAAGHQLTLEDLESKKPGDRGISSKDYEGIIGKTITVDLKKWAFLTKDLIL